MDKSNIVLPDLPEASIAPEPPPKGPVVWMKDNLFSTPFSGVLTIIGLLITAVCVARTLRLPGQSRADLAGGHHQHALADDSGVPG